VDDDMTSEVDELQVERNIVKATYQVETNLSMQTMETSI
jgi:hypothetical protein